MNERDKETWDDMIELLDSTKSPFMAWLEQLKRKFGKYVKPKKYG